MCSLAGRGVAGAPGILGSGICFSGELVPGAQEQGIDKEACAV